MKNKLKIERVVLNEHCTPTFVNIMENIMYIIVQHWTLIYALPNMPVFRDVEKKDRENKSEKLGPLKKICMS